MSDVRRKRILIIAFIGAVIFGAAMKPWERRRPDAATSMQPRAEAQTVAKAATAKTAAVVSAEVVFATVWPDDPFAPADEPERVTPKPVSVKTGGQGPHLVLQGIMTVAGSLSCVINGKPLEQGDQLHGWTVHTIAPDRVVLTRDTERTQLRLP